MTIIYLVRHGETTLSRRSAYCGSTDAPLTATGRRQASLTADRLRPAGIDLVVSSNLIRAQDTAAAIARSTGAPLTIDHRLAEIGYGDLEGLTRSEAEERMGQAYRDWRERPFDHVLPGMEPLDSALARVRAATADAIAAAQSPALVAHQGILRLVLIALGRIGRADYHGTVIATGEVVAVESPQVRPYTGSELPSS